MEAIVATSLAGTSAQITFDEGYPPLAPTEGNQRLLAMYDQASRDVDRQRDDLLDEIGRRLEQRMEQQQLFALRWHVV